MSDVKILGLCGSMRKESYNGFVLKAAQALVPAGAQLEMIELHGIPIFNQDEELAPPEAVLEFKAPDTGGGCNPVCHAGIQLFLAWRSEECDRLGLATLWPKRLAGQTGSSDGRFSR